MESTQTIIGASFVPRSRDRTPTIKAAPSGNIGWDEYANWHLGVDDEASEHTKARYKFPYGDFERVHRCGLNAAEVRAARQQYLDIEDAAVRLREMMDKQDR